MSAQPVAAVELIAGELERARRLLAVAVDRAEALSSLQAIAEELEERLNENRPPRARAALPLDDLLAGRRCDEELKGRITALARRIAPDQEEP